MKTRRAISPVIAIIIIVAVTIAIAVAVAGWLMGLWGGYAKGGPQLQITYAEVKTDGTGMLKVTNKGSGTAKIDIVKVAGVELNLVATTVTDGQYNATIGTTTASTEPWNLAAGETATIYFDVGTTFAAGQSVDVEVVDTSSGARASTTVPASP